MKTTLDRIARSRFTFPIALLGLTVLAYGLFSLSLGFYLDDWYIILTQDRFGALGFFQFFKIDRPFLAYVYTLTMPIFGDSRVGWQVFALFTRWLATLSFWVLLDRYFPSQKRLWKWAAILFLVYPGFQFHWFAVMYSQIYLLMAAYFASYIGMLNAIRAQRRWAYALWTLLGVACLIVGIVPMEYFYGMELARPILLWLLFYRETPNGWRSAKVALLHWIPYLAVFAGFTFYRIAFGHTYWYKIAVFDQIQANPLQALLTTAGNVFWWLFDALLTTWWNLTQLLRRDLLNATALLMLAVVAAGFLIILLAVRRGPEAAGERRHNPGLPLAAFGLYLTGVALIPFVAAGFRVTLDFPDNRFLLSLAPGVSLFAVGIVEGLLRTDRQKIASIALLGALAAGSQFLAARSFYLLWQAQTDFFWQLSWRAPGLQPGTLLLTGDVPFSKYFSGLALSAPMNLIYSPEERTERLDQLILLTFTPEGSYIPAYAPGQPIQYEYRTFTFTGSTDAMLVFYKPSNGCLRILSRADATQDLPASKNVAFWSQAIPLSNLGRIVAAPDAPAQVPAKFFGREDRDQWCYYFEKADLARQTGDWGAVIEWYARAEESGFSPGRPQEWLPLVDAYLHTGQAEPLAQIGGKIPAGNPDEVASFCTYLRGQSTRLALDGPVSDAVAAILADRGCR